MAAIKWRLDEWGGWTILGFKAVGTTALTAGVVGAMITFIGIVFSVLLMAVRFVALALQLSDHIRAFMP